ncbi:MAG: RusA family crossover junction endodeoxyribonuclease [Nitrospirae bacterium]|nr:RusA family crossover junction endodeoxyribonuclease [Nitrospirota bacterium]
MSISLNQITLTLPIPPTINQQYATVQGRRVLSSQGRKYKANVAQHLHLALLQHPHKKDVLHAFQSQFLSLTIIFYFQTLLRRDLDGGLKITQDALCDALSTNDNRILEIHLTKNTDKNDPRIECILSIVKPARGLKKKT